MKIMRVAGGLDLQLPVELAEWLEDRDDLSAVWRECPEAHWLVHLATAVGVTRALVVHAAADVVSSALAGRSDRRGLSSLRVARAWLDGRASSSEAWASGFASAGAADGEADAATGEALRAAACVAFACDHRADAAFYAHRADAARAVELAVRLLGDDGPRAAAWVRARITLPEFLAAIERASTPSLLLGETDPEPGSFYT